MRWSQIGVQQPALGSIVHERLIEPGALLVGTTRRDGSARISGAEPLIMDDELWLSMMSASMKAHDLRRDPRVLLHSLVPGPEPSAEVKVRGTVREATDPKTQHRYAAAVADRIGWQPVVGRFILFAVDIDDLTYIGYDPDTGGQHVARWPADVEYLRPATTPTSLGPPQPLRRLLTT